MANKKQMGVGAGMLAAATAGVAAGYYFYASKDAKKNRKVAAKWAGDLKSDVVKQAKKVQDLDRAQMLAIIDQAATTYETVRSLNRADLSRAVKELKSNWQNVVGEAKPAAKRSVRKAAVKKASKRS